ncbi:MAG TPA: PCRF domain-containing protein [Candidatus Paceibacterota bacterium]|nr:PCRF domain-containing protein [Candidatus Paceibacterota bacterium]HOL54118.1 PCRF domain-containing protein [Candidatus Paceibacterota bacterium]HON21839.1 PCRF domain-containing protein [Candidatus Paceibacterota bacterium]HOV88924.1 PCRF domain-containing protein [Candidatus Paceibacterota bacterium]HPP17021.1 PCRF domain-containing protein [Candidatus Paceibacterota bacterium]
MSEVNSVILEIRAGVGGEEAALFAAELLRMYQRYAQKRGWQSTLLDISYSSLGGVKEAVLEITGDGVEILKNEGGVHRVQRIPATEKSGRVHTSTASVAVMSRPKEAKIDIKPEDLEITFFRSSGPGGQNVNKVETAVRVLHKPSGLIVSCQSERSQFKNREKAIEMLKTKLYEAKWSADQGKISEERRQQIGTADRSEKIKTYNFPQDRLTDHRYKKNFHNLEKIMDGDLDDVLKIYQKNPSVNQ